MSAAPESPPINLFSPETLIDPYDAYRTLRDQAPVYAMPGLGVHVVTRYDLLREAIKDTATYSSQFDAFMAMTREAGIAGVAPETRAEFERIARQMVHVPPTMLTLDEPDHTKYRSLVSELFTASRIKAGEPAVRAVIDAAADAFVDGDQHEFMAGFAFPVPLRIIADRLGIPEDGRAFFDDAATAAASGLRMSPLTEQEQVRRARLALDLQRFLIELIEERRRAPREDMISILATRKLAEEDRHLTHGEALSILGQFLVAGHETTSSTFGWGMKILCERPDVQERLRADPRLMRTFVDEALRLESPVQGLPRVVKKDTTLGGCPLHAGQFVMLRYGAANRDERQFENPDVCDIDREKAGMQLAFGSGVHHCIGAPLARQELHLGFTALIERMRDIRFSPGAELAKAEPSFILRNLPFLHIDYTKVAANG